MHNSKRLGILVLFSVLMLGAAQIFAYPDTGGCRTCHPNYQGGPGNATHDLHVGSARMTNNCQLCHSSFFDAPVDINGSLAGVSCVGCHLPNGLWQRHQASGISCTPCHSNWPTPDPENTLPPYYSRSDVLVTNPCKTNTAEGGEDWDGDGRGLDNDGDTAYDGADSDCESVPVEKQTWGTIKALYSE